MPTLTRRGFVKTCAAITAVPEAHADAPDLRFPTAPRDRLSVASYPFRASMDRPGHPGLKLTEFAAMIADKFGIRNIEPLSSHFPSTEPA